MRRPAARAIVAAFAGLSVLLTACGQTPGNPQGSADDGIVDVVASTSVYGDIVSTIGGDKVRVESIITRTSQDPHSYEATTQDKLAVSKAELLVENGGGYDGFIHKLADDTGLDHGRVLNAVELSGLAPEEDSRRLAPTPTGTATTMRASTSTSGTACRPWPGWRMPSRPSSASWNRPPRRRSAATPRPSRTRSAASKPSWRASRRPPARRLSPSRNRCRSTCSRPPAWKTRPRLSTPPRSKKTPTCRPPC